MQEFLGEYHEDTHITLETDSSAVNANAERLGCGRMKHIGVKYRYLQDASTRKSVSRQLLQNMLTGLKIELTEPPTRELVHQHDHVPNLFRRSRWVHNKMQRLDLAALMLVLGTRTS